MSNLELAKTIIKEHYKQGEYGIFNTRNFAGDHMITIYRGNTLTVDWCPEYEYFEVFGLTKEEFKELSIFYSYLGEL